ncbi:MAG TPA: glucans biosynthesis glucosyltransferase MdoH [Xanthobacteraceae bacterium]|nr:glucans biosynthesis glucosyltransferase MdoH [Xanthobacteraceae bacterium]
MSALTSLAPDASIRSLPPECPLAMPEQRLWEARRAASAPGTGPRGIAVRRLTVIGATALMTGVAAGEMYKVLKIAGLTIPESIVLVLFVALFAWIAFSSVGALIGFFLDLARRPAGLPVDVSAPLPPLASANALLLPTYNEDPHRVTARLQAICESVAEAGRIGHFDFFILSDTTDPDIWLLEEQCFLRLRQELGAHRIYYRHRLNNTGRKSGNIAEWIKRFGGRYDHMIVLDADSLMTGDTIVRLAAAMERNPRVGLIQTFPVLVNGTTLFARVQQFAGRIYGPLIARGLAWWHGSESNYWGHNAIIRVRAFADQAGLPLLGGRKPFGGHILSHDFVEAALMRRAGWGVHMAPSVPGSYEECPPSITDYALRDRRWCQGNLQHLGVLPARGLHWMSRLHLVTGIGSYVTSPLWLAFLLVGMLISLQAQFVRPEYFSGRSLFPQWPAQDPVRAAWVFAGTMAVLLTPKFLGYFALLARPQERRACGGGLRALASVVLEVLVSGLMAPIMMLLQTRSVAEVVCGRDSGWAAQRRDDGRLPRRELVRAYAWPTLLGLLLGAGAYAISVPLFLWMTPVLAGLVFAIPIVALTSDPEKGKAPRVLGLLRTPEEHAVPQVLSRANELSARSAKRNPAQDLQGWLTDPGFVAAHLAMLPGPAVRRKGEVDAARLVARAKIAEADNLAEALEMLSRPELFAALGDREAVEALARLECARCGG